MNITEFFKSTIDGELSLEQQKKYLLDNPFPPAQEIADAVNYLYKQMPQVPQLDDAIDVCGTGGSGLPTLNTSTLSALVVAGANVKVAKHGNNAASGKFGSFDLLGALDIPISLSVPELQLRYNEYNLALLYAKSFHPVMRFFAPVRAGLGRPTFFNILGPLLSPVRAQKQLVGTPKIEYARLIAEVAKLLGKERVIVAVGHDGLDEVTLSGPTTIVELENGEIDEYEITPKDFGVEPVAGFDEIASAEPEDNIKTAKAILDGRENSRKTDLVLVNAAMALYLAGKSDDLKQCYKLAKEALESGKARTVLENYRLPGVLAKIVARDARRDFTATGKLPEPGKKYTGGLIAEIKRASPSEGDINSDVDIAEQARLYERSSAAAISVLTEPEDFHGSFKDLKDIRKVVNLPILCKDFIVRKEHIDKAKSCGADIVLLIAAILDEEKLRELYGYATSRGLQAIVEVHTESELEKALKVNPEIIGVNARNLHDFSLHPEIFEQLALKIPNDIIKIAESGIGGFKDVPKNYGGILTGTVLMKHPFPQLKVKELAGRPLLKLCGIREVKDAELCERLGADMIGINFVPRSKRSVTVEQGKKIVEACQKTIPVGVFENQSPAEVNRIAHASGVKAVQLSGSERELKDYQLPVIKTIRIGGQKPPEAFMSLLDSEVAGSGKRIDDSRIKQFEPSLIAGGVDLAVAEELLASKKPLGIDTASGIETGGKVDSKKIKALCKLVSSVKYSA